VRTLSLDSLGTKAPESALFALGSCFLYDLVNQLGDQLAPLLFFDLLPTRQGIETNAVLFDEIGARKLFAASSGNVLFGAIIPTAVKLLTVAERFGAVDPGPEKWVFHQALFDGLGK
jgi:hypothetical protein